MKGPQQVLRATTLWEEGVPVKQLPYSFDDEHARREKFPKVRVSVIAAPTRRDTRFWMSRANASKSGMGMWPGAYCVRSSWSEASLADIVSAAVAEGGGGVDV